jgi:hypothetical protein
MYVGVDFIRWRNVSAGARPLLRAFTAHNIQAHWLKRSQANGTQKQEVALSLRWESNRLHADCDQTIQILRDCSIHHGILSRLKRRAPMVVFNQAGWQLGNARKSGKREADAGGSQP